MLSSATPSMLSTLRTRIDILLNLVGSLLCAYTNVASSPTSHWKNDPPALAVEEEAQEGYEISAKPYRGNRNRKRTNVKLRSEESSPNITRFSDTLRDSTHDRRTCYGWVVHGCSVREGVKCQDVCACSNLYGFGKASNIKYWAPSNTSLGNGTFYWEL